MEGQANLLKIVDAVDALSGVLGLAKRRQQKGNPNGNNRYPHQEINQSEHPSGVAGRG